MAKESQRLERINFPRASVGISSSLSNVRHVYGECVQFNPIHPSSCARWNSANPFAAYFPQVNAVAPYADDLGNRAPVCAGMVA
jgi:hypothetical protein